LYGTNAQETKITLFSDGGDKLVGCFQQVIEATKEEKKMRMGANFLSLGWKCFPLLEQKSFHFWVKKIFHPYREFFY